MRVFAFSEARQNLATVLKLAQTDGSIRVRHRDGRVFTIRPETTEDSPLDIASVPLNLSREEIVASVRESRER